MAQWLRGPRFKPQHLHGTVGHRRAHDMHTYMHEWIHTYIYTRHSDTQSKNEYILGEKGFNSNLFLVSVWPKEMVSIKGHQTKSQT